MTEEENRRLIQHRLEEAQQTVADVELLINNERFRSAVNRIYYGMFYALLALATAHKVDTSKHIRLIGWFNKDFVKEGKIDSKFGKIINKAFNKRSKGDYDSFVEFEKPDVSEMFEEMKAFITEIKRILNTAR